MELFSRTVGFLFSWTKLAGLSTKWQAAEMEEKEN